MKSLKAGKAPKKVAEDWHGMKVTCQSCGAEGELEIGDFPMLSVEKTGEKSITMKAQVTCITVGCNGAMTGSKTIKS